MSESYDFKSVALPSVAVVSLLLAGYMFYSSLFASPINEMPDTPDSTSPWVCRACDHGCLLTPRERARIQMSGGQEWGRRSDDEGRQTGMRYLKIRCPVCESIDMVPATQCPDCSTIFDGETCSKCEETAADTKA